MKLIIGNWKMHPYFADEAKRIFSSVKKTASKLGNVNTVICPPFVYIHELKKISKGKVALCAQDLFHETAGPYTGEVSGEMLKDVGAEFVLAGHSERRGMGETNSDVSLKVQAAHKAGLTAVVCIGETVRDQSGSYLDHVARDLRESFSKVQKKNLKKCIVAYEPVWAIGKGDSLPPELIEEMAIFITKNLSDLYGQDEGKAVPVLYGGSVTGRNAEEIIKRGGVDGLLVGHESLNPESFMEILKAAEKA